MFQCALLWLVVINKIVIHISNIIVSNIIIAYVIVSYFWPANTKLQTLNIDDY